MATGRRGGGAFADSGARAGLGVRLRGPRFRQSSAFNRAVLETLLKLALMGILYEGILGAYVEKKLRFLDTITPRIQLNIY